MPTKNYSGIQVELNEEGYMVDSTKWTEEVAKEIAKEENIDLTEKHIAVLHYLRQKYEKGEQLTIRSINKSGIVDVKGFYGLFPGAPLKLACKIAGLPKPTSCV
ncbi:MAG: TusE/DsrC/DsvC family sulfur relay protein [Candidatus Kapaibacteriales bacterium]